MKRTWTIIGVGDVPGSFKWYQSLFGQPETSPAHDYFGQILDSDGTVLLCLHEWGAHEHPSLTSPDTATPGKWVCDRLILITRSQGAVQLSTLAVSFTVFPDRLQVLRYKKPTASAVGMWPSHADQRVVPHQRRRARHGERNVAARPGPVFNFSFLALTANSQSHRVFLSRAYKQTAPGLSALGFDAISTGNVH
jgi:hypothetical protein